MTRVKEVPQHAVEVEIHEAWTHIQQKRPVAEHFLVRQQPVFELFEHLRFERSPLVETAAAKFAFLVPDEPQMISLGHEFPPVDVREPERHVFNLAFDVSPEDT